jgi:signal transduction histidine kinase
MDALHEIPQEQRMLTVSTTAEAGDRVRVVIQDSGTGIPEHVRLKLFDPFFTTKSSGMGMGLPISQTIVNDHKGKISVHSEPGKGARFEILLPMQVNYQPKEVAG